MASFVVVGQHRTVLVRSQTQVEDVMEITAIAQPAGITFVRNILYTTWLGGGVAVSLQPIADHIEQIVEQYPVVGGAPVQAVDAAGLITNAVDFIVTIPGQQSSPTPAHTATVEIPVQVLHDATDFSSYFVPVIQALQAGHSA